LIWTGSGSSRLSCLHLSRCNSSSYLLLCSQLSSCFLARGLAAACLQTSFAARSYFLFQLAALVFLEKHNNAQHCRQRLTARGHNVLAAFRVKLARSRSAAWTGFGLCLVLLLRAAFRSTAALPSCPAHASALTLSAAASAFCLHSIHLRARRSLPFALIRFGSAKRCAALLCSAATASDKAPPSCLSLFTLDALRLQTLAAQLPSGCASSLLAAAQLLAQRCRSATRFRRAAAARSRRSCGCRS
jgi:hypothetical protein